MYVDDDCREIGIMIVDMLDIIGGFDWIVDVFLVFGDMELYVIGRDWFLKEKVLVIIDLLKNN